MLLPLMALILLFGVIHMPNFVAARFCEGGHICSLPRECCTQGCCPPYQSGPRQLPPPSEHVLNLFFISHWFFWCVVVAIILAILCAYSLWKKRRTLCGWGFPEHHAQSEGDSAGSCYAPPQYSRCNSFHHPPPPYTEVTSKPDLYPLVFTCNSDNGKNGSSYLMVQYFRNYIVRPAGSLSAASTVDSLSSSFICNINEANTLVPPPYSRAASPEIGFSSHFQQQYMMPRSASQLVCATNGGNSATAQADLGGSNIATQQVYQGHRNPHYAVVALNSTMGAVGGGNSAAVGNGNANGTTAYSTRLCVSEGDPFQHNDSNDSADSSRSGCGSGCSAGSGSGNGYSTTRERDTHTNNNNNNNNNNNHTSTGFIQSQSDQHFRYMANSNSSISDIFVSNSFAGATMVTSGSGRSITESDNGSGVGMPRHPQSGGTPVIFSNGCIKPNPLHRASTNPTPFIDASAASATREHIYNSCNSVAGISLTVPPPSSERSESEFRDLHMLRRSLETCCQMLQKQQSQQQQQQQQQQQKLPSTGFTNGADSPLHLNELAKKYAEEGIRSYMTSGTCSGVSSLANIGTPSSPPQATSPTGEVREILDQIRQLQEGVSYEDLMLHMRPVLRHTLSSPSNAVAQHKFLTSETYSVASPTNAYALEATGGMLTNSNPKTKESHSSSSSIEKAAAAATQKVANVIKSATSGGSSASVRPSTLQQQQMNKKKFYTPKPNKAMYIPMLANPTMPSNRCILKSPVSSVVGTNFFATRGRVRKIWVSRSAPTTPGTALPPNRLGDDSPLLTEHDEEQEGEQNE